MAEDTNKKAIERLITGINAGDVSVMDEVFHEDAVIEWPQFGERIRGADNRRAVYSHIPVLPKIKPRRLFGKDDLWIAEGLFDYEGAKYNAILVFEFRGNKIIQETAYWAQPSPPADWRAQWTEQL